MAYLDLKVKSPSKFLSRVFLRGLLENRFLSPRGLEYPEGEVIDMLNEKETRLSLMDLTRQMEKQHDSYRQAVGDLGALPPNKIESAENAVNVLCAAKNSDDSNKLLASHGASSAVCEKGEDKHGNKTEKVKVAKNETANSLSGLEIYFGSRRWVSGDGLLATTRETMGEKVELEYRGAAMKFKKYKHNQQLTRKEADELIKDSLQFLVSLTKEVKSDVHANKTR